MQKRGLARPTSGVFKGAHATYGTGAEAVGPAPFPWKSASALYERSLVSATVSANIDNYTPNIAHNGAKYIED